MTTEKKKTFIINCIFIALIAGLIFVGMKYLWWLLLPFVIGFFVAMSIQRPANFLHRKTKIPQKLIAIVLVIFILLALAYLLWMVIYQLVTEVGGVADYLSTFISDIPNLLKSLKEKWPSVFAYFDGTLDAPPLVDTKVILEKAQELLGNIATSVTSWTINAAKSIPSFLVTLIVTIVACCFISIDYDNIVIFIKKQLSPRVREILTQSKQIFYSSIFKMIKAYALIMSITFVELAIGLSVIRIDHSIPLAALICLIDILPVLGTGTVMIPWAIIDLLLGNTLLALYLIIIYAIITIIRNIIEPRIVGQQVGLHPVLTLLLMYVGLKLFGMMGMFLFPITMIIIVTLHNAGTIRIWKDITDEDVEKHSNDNDDGKEDKKKQKRKFSFLKKNVSNCCSENKQA